jgi:hypothetical protein
MFAFLLSLEFLTLDQTWEIFSYEDKKNALKSQAIPCLRRPSLKTKDVYLLSSTSPEGLRLSSATPLKLWGSFGSHLVIVAVY